MYGFSHSFQPSTNKFRSPRELAQAADEITAHGEDAPRGETDVGGSREEIMKCLDWSPPLSTTTGAGSKREVWICGWSGGHTLMEHWKEPVPYSIFHAGIYSSLMEKEKRPHQIDDRSRCVFGSGPQRTELMNFLDVVVKLLLEESRQASCVENV